MPNPQIKHTDIPQNTFKLAKMYYCKEISTTIIYNSLEKTSEEYEELMAVFGTYNTHAAFNKAGQIHETKLTSSTLWAVLADVSINTNPFSLANCSPSSVLTALLCARSHLFPISMIDMLELACCRASSNQLARWLNVSLLKRYIH